MWIGAVATPHLALWSWKQGFRIQMHRNNASCLTFRAVDILFDWDKSLLELDSPALSWPAVWQSLFVFYLSFSFFDFLFICALAGQWALLSSASLPLSRPCFSSHREVRVGQRESGKNRVDQKSNLGESCTEVELRFKTYSNHHGQWHVSNIYLRAIRTHEVNCTPSDVLL